MTEREKLEQAINALESQRAVLGDAIIEVALPLFEFEAFAPLQIKGKAELLAVYRLLRAKTAPGPVRGIAGLQAPLVGRDAELSALQALVEQARQLTDQGQRMQLYAEADRILMQDAALTPTFRASTCWSSPG